MAIEKAETPAWLDVLAVTMTTVGVEQKQLRRRTNFLQLNIIRIC